MVQRTVLKVDLSCLKCKKKLLKAVSALEGVDKIELDSAKETLIVTGDADPYKIIVSARKAGKHVEVVSIGPPPPPPKPDDKKKTDDKKKPDDKKPDAKKPDSKDSISIHNPYTYPESQRMNVVYLERWNEPNPQCSIM